MSKNSVVMLLVKESDAMYFDDVKYLPVGFFNDRAEAAKAAIDDISKKSPKLNYLKSDLGKYGTVEVEIKPESVEKFS